MKIAGIYGNIEESSSYYRGFCPLAELRKTDPTVEIVNSEHIYNTQQDRIGLSLLSLKGSDLVFFLRPVGIIAIKRCKQFRFPIVVDYDDNFLQVPQHNRAHKYYTSQKIDYIEAVIYALQNADLVTVSTPALAQEFEPYNSNIRVRPNSFDDYTETLFQERNKTSCNGKPVVLWRGTATHSHDLMAVKDEYIKLIQSNPDFEFLFWGDFFESKDYQERQAFLWVQEAERDYKNVGILPLIHPFEYMTALQKLKPVLTLVPLEPTSFNECKSDIAKIESIAAGSLCLAPDMPEWIWDGANLFNYSSGVPGSFYNHANSILEYMRQGYELIEQEYDKSLKYLKANKLLSNNNKLRLNLYKDLLKDKTRV